MRRNSVLFDRRLFDWEPKPQFIPFPEFEQPVPPANPVIPILQRRLAELDTEPRPILPQFYPIIVFQPAPPPASPVVAVRIGQDIVAPLEAFVGARHLAFPYFQEAAAAANSIIPILTRRLEELAVELRPTLSQFYQLVLFQELLLAANPVISFRYGRDILSWPEWESWARSQFLVFPEFEQPPASAKPVIAFRYGQDVLSWLAWESWARSQFLSNAALTYKPIVGLPNIGVVIIRDGRFVPWNWR